ncbi:unnamed protein product [Rotaria sp. Silwood2]|nr:unnamed protein product [Rotaria sp. Silwood2]
MGPLQWIEQHATNQGHARQIFLLTDGEMSNVTTLLNLFKGLARSTNGRFVFVPPNSSVDVYVGEQLQRALQPWITNIHVNWNLDVNVQIQTAPK